MSLEGTVQNGVIVLDPNGPPLADGTRVEVAPRTGMEPLIRKTPGVIGGNACIRNTRIAVWMLVMDRKLGMTDAAVLDDFPSLTSADLDAAWTYYRENPIEIEQAIWFNDTAANVPDGVLPPVWVIVSGRLLGLPDDAIRETFEPPLSAADLDAAWAAYRTDPRQVAQDVVAHRLAG